MAKKGKYVKCEYCGRELKEDEINYVEGRPYCENCVSEAEIYVDTGDDEDDEDDEDEDD